MSAINAKVIEELRALQTDGSNFLAELIDLFLNEAAAHVVRLREGVTTRQAPLLERASHTLKGSCGNLGAQAMSRIAAELQDASKKEDWARIEPLVGRIELEFTFVKAELLVERDRR